MRERGNCGRSWKSLPASCLPHWLGKGRELRGRELGGGNNPHQLLQAGKQEGGGGGGGGGEEEEGEGWWESLSGCDEGAMRQPL